MPTVMHNSATINLNIVEACRRRNMSRILLFLFGLHVSRIQSRGSRIIPIARRIPLTRRRPTASTAGKSCSASGCISHINATTASSARIARYHNIFGPEGTWNGGREKAPAAICRKVAEARNGGDIEIWGDGHQTRSFLYIDECVEGTTGLAWSTFSGPVNIGSEEMVTINGLVDMVCDIAGKKLE